MHASRDVPSARGIAGRWQSTGTACHSIAGAARDPGQQAAHTLSKQLMWLLGKHSVSASTGSMCGLPFFTCQTPGAPLQESCAVSSGVKLACVCTLKEETEESTASRSSLGRAGLPVACSSSFERVPSSMVASSSSAPPISWPPMNTCTPSKAHLMVKLCQVTNSEVYHDTQCDCKCLMTGGSQCARCWQPLITCVPSKGSRTQQGDSGPVKCKWSGTQPTFGAGHSHCKNA